MPLVSPCMVPMHAYRTFQFNCCLPIDLVYWMLASSLPQAYQQYLSLLKFLDLPLHFGNKYQNFNFVRLAYKACGHNPFLSLAFSARCINPVHTVCW